MGQRLPPRLVHSPTLPPLATGHPHRGPTHTSPGEVRVDPTRPLDDTGADLERVEPGVASCQWATPRRGFVTRPILTCEGRSPPRRPPAPTAPRRARYPPPKACTRRQRGSSVH